MQLGMASSFSKSSLDEMSVMLSSIFGIYHPAIISPPATQAKMTSVAPVTIAIWRQPSCRMDLRDVPSPSAAMAIRSPHGLPPEK